MNKIEEEYKNYQVPEEVKEEITDPYVFVLSIEEMVKQLEKDEKRVLRKRRRNRIAQDVLVSSRDILFEEGKCLNESLDLIDAFINYLISVTEIITEETLDELIKLVDFMVTHYTGNQGFIEGKITSLEQYLNGINYIDNRHQDTRKEVKEFLDQKIARMKKEKELAKKQEI